MSTRNFLVEQWGIEKGREDVKKDDLEPIMALLLLYMLGGLFMVAFAVVQ